MDDFERVTQQTEDDVAVFQGLLQDYTEWIMTDLFELIRGVDIEDRTAVKEITNEIERHKAVLLADLVVAFTASQLKFDGHGEAIPLLLEMSESYRENMKGMGK